MKVNNYDSSIKFLNRVLIITSISVFFIPIILYLYINIGANKLLESKDYYRVVTTKNYESIEKIETLDKPLTNVENIKDWLRVSMIDLYSYNALNYGSEERLNKFKKVFTSSELNKIWQPEITRVENEISNGYMINSAVISEDPKLVGTSVAGDGSKLWKFYLELSFWSRSNQTTSFLDRRKKVMVLVQEINPNENFKGVAIVKIDIK